MSEHRPDEIIGRMPCCGMPLLNPPRHAIGCKHFPMPKQVNYQPDTRDARIAELEAEIERLKDDNATLQYAVDNRFGSKATVKMVQRLERAEATLRDRESTIVSQQEELHLLRPRVKELECEREAIRKEHGEHIRILSEEYDQKIADLEDLII